MLSFGSDGCFSPVFCGVPGPLAGAKVPTKDSGTPAEQQYVRSVIDLHDKYLGFVSTCFSNATLFHKALKVSSEQAGRQAGSM